MHCNVSSYLVFWAIFLGLLIKVQRFRRLLALATILAMIFFFENTQSKLYVKNLSKTLLTEKDAFFEIDGIICISYLFGLKVLLNISNGT